MAPNGNWAAVCFDVLIVCACVRLIAKKPKLIDGTKMTETEKREKMEML